MNNSDKAEFGRIWKAVREEYARPVTKEGLKIMFNALIRYDIDQIKKAITLHINDTDNGQFPIMPAHVVAQIEGRGDERAGAAWRKLYAAIGEIGNYSDVIFDDAIIHAIVDNEGGWQHVCMMVEDDLKFMQARFNKQYVQYVSKSGLFDYSKILRGAINLDRMSKNLEIDPPQTVGNVEKCRQVYRIGTDNRINIGRPNSIDELLVLETGDIKLIKAKL